MVADGTIPPRARPEPVPAPEAPGFAEVGKNVGDVWVAVQAYFLAQAARVRVAARNFVFLAILAIFGGVLGLTIVISSAVLLTVGIADALAALLGGRQWAGDLIVGFGVVGGGALIGYLVISKMMKSVRKQTISSYQKQKSQN